MDYTPPVNRLLTFGEARSSPEWPDYLELGLREEHIPELIRMATDMSLHEADRESTEVWAPLHAWRVLGQLGAEQAIKPLVSLLTLDDDWVGEELPTVFAMIGTEAIPALAEYLADESHELFSRIHAASGLGKIGNAHPEVRSQCLEILVNQLQRFTQNDPTLNGMLISELIDLKGKEAMPVIEKAFEADSVDISIAGDIEDVQMEMGLRRERSTPKPDYFPEAALLRAELNRTSERVRAEKKPQKQKIGRNDPCPCGSGKKYKKCCLGKA